MEKIMTKREVRAIALMTAPEQRSENRFNSEQYVEGYATTFNAPYLMWEDGYTGYKYYEAIDRHALDEADMSDVKLQYNHGGRVLARMKNNTLNLQATDRGLFVEADLSKTDASRALYEDIRSGMVSEMSWAFTVAEDSFDEDRDNKTYTRTIKRVKKVYDVSAVDTPANPETTISARDCFNGVIEAVRAERLEERKRQLLLEIRKEELLNDYQRD